MILPFTVNGTKIEKASDFPNVVSGADLVAEFRFSEDWFGKKAVAKFSQFDNDDYVALDENGRCNIPPSVLRMSIFSVSAIDENRVSTDKVFVRKGGN